MRLRLLGLAGAASIALPTLAFADGPSDLRASRQYMIQDTLERASARSVAAERSNCALGRQPVSIAQRRAIGIHELPDASDYCVVVLTRLGRDRTLGYIRDPSNPRLTAALAFDNGFVAGYLRREPVTSATPTMASVRSVIERCLALQEANTTLCNAAGLIVGARAASGEVVQAR